MLGSIVIMDRNNDVLPCNFDEKAGSKHWIQKGQPGPVEAMVHAKHTNDTAGLL
jgi:hypothetical protein